MASSAPPAGRPRRRKSGLPISASSLSALCDAPLEAADNLLLSAIGRADNTGAAYNADHNTLFQLGQGPILAEVVEAEIELQTTVTGLKIWAINPAGSIIGPVPETLADGKLRFTLGGPFPSIYYLIQKQ